MNKIFVIILFLNTIFSKPLEWSFEKEFALQKDESIFAEVSMPSGAKNFSMHWTLFKKDGIVILLKYDGFMHQFILYPDYQRNTFILNLDNTGGKITPKLFLIFKSFEQKKAYFWIGTQGDVNFLTK